MAIIEEGTCLIKFVNQQGLGCGKTPLGLVEVPYSLPNEIISFERHEYRRQSNCLLKKIEQSSVHRIIPECKYFGRCGGCMLQHMDQQTYDDFKLSLIKNVLPSSVVINPIVTIPKGNRRRVNLQALKKDERIFLGFYRFHSHQIIDIDSCPAIMSSLSEILIPLKEMFMNILEHRQKAEIFLTQASNGIDMLIELQNLASLTLKQDVGLKDFAKKNGIIRLQLRLLDKTNTLFESEKPYILLGNKKVATDAKCFLQASFLSDQILVELVERYLPQEEATVADLFCGRGTFSLPLNKRFKIEGFESDVTALHALEEAAEGTIKLYKRDLFTTPLTKAELQSYRFVIINPPRAGALKQIKELAYSTCKIIVYISCNPESFASDAAILEKGKYKLVEVTPVDQFYWSSHLEIVGIFALTE
tara:strand:- start:20 stop:1273 length:1254 start_codon:yes stop_codon:yes gene_type:complete